MYVLTNRIVCRQCDWGLLYVCGHFDHSGDIGWWVMHGV